MSALNDFFVEGFLPFSFYMATAPVAKKNGLARMGGPRGFLRGTSRTDKKPQGPPMRTTERCCGVILKLLLLLTRIKRHEVHHTSQGKDDAVKLEIKLF